LRSYEATKRVEERIGVASSLRLEREPRCRGNPRLVRVEGRVTSPRERSTRAIASADAQEVMRPSTAAEARDVVDTTEERARDSNDEEERNFAEETVELIREGCSSSARALAATERRRTATAAGRALAYARENHRPGGHAERRLEPEEARPQKCAESREEKKRQDKRAAGRRGLSSTNKADEAGVPLTCARSHSRSPQHHAARAAPGRTITVLRNGRHRNKPVVEDSRRPELGRTQFMIRPHCGLGGFPAPPFDPSDRRCELSHL